MVNSGSWVWGNETEGVPVGCSTARSALLRGLASTGFKIGWRGTPAVQNTNVYSLTAAPVPFCSLPSAPSAAGLRSRSLPSMRNTFWSRRSSYSR